MLTVPLPRFATQMLAKSKATPKGLVPTGKHLHRPPAGAGNCTDRPGGCAGTDWSNGSPGNSRPYRTRRCSGSARPHRQHWSAGSHRAYRTTGTGIRRCVLHLCDHAPSLPHRHPRVKSAQGGGFPRPPDPPGVETLGYSRGVPRTHSSPKSAHGAIRYNQLFL